MPPVDPLRLEAEWDQNLEVLERLEASGDQPEIPRTVDVSFRGESANLACLADAAEDFGFRIQSLELDERGRPWLFLERIQTADRKSIRQLTELYLQMAAMFDVECDGWGCMEQTGSQEQ